jgi:predicted phage terminase large subunit-like protein
MTMDYNPIVFFLGTPKGKMAKKHEHSETGYSLYYELACKGGLDNSPVTPGWITKTYSSHDNPYLNPELIAEIEADVPHVIRQQEVYGKFLDAGKEEVFKNDWFHIQDTISVPVIRKIISADTAFKKGASNDCTALVVISETHNGYVIEDCICKQLEYPELIKAVTELYSRNSEAIALLVEDKASGQSLIQSLKSDTTIPVIPVSSTTDKVTRANAVTGLFESGKVSLLSDCAWNRMLIDQLCSFSAALDTPDDIVDAVSQGLNWLKTRQKIGAPIVTRSIMRTNPILRGY